VRKGEAKDVVDKVNLPSKIFEKLEAYEIAMGERMARQVRLDALRTLHHVILKAF